VWQGGGGGGRQGSSGTLCSVRQQVAAVALLPRAVEDTGVQLSVSKCVWCGEVW